MKKIPSLIAMWLLALLVLQAPIAMAQTASPSTTPGIDGAAGPWPACPGCDLSNRDFRNRVLENVNLSKANLSGADFSGATLRGVGFNGAVLKGANFSGAKVEPGRAGRTSFVGADLSGAIFSGASLGGADMQYATMDCPAVSLVAAAGARVGVATGNPGCAAAAPRAEAVAADWNCADANLTGLASAVYVASNGNDSGTCGQSASAPCKTIAQGLAQCSGSNCGVLVGFGVYTLTSPLALASGKRIYGGCAAGTVASGGFSVLNGPPGGVPAITASGVTSAAVQSFSIFGTNINAVGGAPSVAVSLSANSNVTLSFIKITAGQGGTGTAGVNGVAATAGAGASGSSGGSSSCNAAGGGGGVGMTTNVEYNVHKVTSCPTYCSSNSCNGYGGGGGSASLAGAGGGHPGPYCQLACISSCNNLTGYSGAGGRTGSCGAGATATGVVDGSYVNGVWTASRGADGIAGVTGGGGGGGGGGAACGYVCFWVQDNKPGAAGGGGGAGGCGATQGTGGQQGGASIGLQVVQSTTALNSVTVYAGAGGQGGNGGANGAAAAGGWSAGGSTPSGASPVAGTGGSGGAGGWGTSSGAGAGGNGGPSYGFVFVSSPQPPNMSANPTLTGLSTGVGLPGVTAAAPSGVPCTSNQAVQGVPGRVTDYVSFN